MTSKKQLDPFGFCFNIWHEILYILREYDIYPSTESELFQTNDMSARVRVQLFEDVK
jgi:hypothetical protein